MAYPLFPVSESSAGGAEQVLWTLERELAAAGWHTVVAACAGSHVSGRLLETGDPPHLLARFSEREREHTEAIVAECARNEYGIILDHSSHFFRHARRVNPKVLATLHLPRSFYPPSAFADVPGNVLFACVSQSQIGYFRDVPRVAGVVRNGIAVERFHMGRARGNYLLWLGRVCPEKAPHLAVMAARQAGMDIVIAGEIHPFDSHQQYWENELRPLVDGRRVRWVRQPDFERKHKLLREAKALLITSQVPETSSLVAMEAMACGTPVITFDTGALSEVVVSQTGYIVRSVQTMAAACTFASAIRARDCRDWVEKYFSGRAMLDGYLNLLYNIEEAERLAGRRRATQVPQVAQSLFRGFTGSED